MDNQPESPSLIELACAEPSRLVHQGDERRRIRREQQRFALRASAAIWSRHASASGSLVMKAAARAERSSGVGSGLQKVLPINGSRIARAAGKVRIPSRTSSSPPPPSALAPRISPTSSQP